MLGFLLLLAMPTIGCAGTSFFPKLVVSGAAVLHKPADEVSLTIGVLTQAETAAQALGDNNEKMHDVLTNILALGLQKGEYHTEQFSIRPIHSQPPRNPPQDWKAEIVAFEVSNSLTIKTRKMELAALIIDAAGKSGATQVYNISFGLHEPQQYRSEAISVATSNAMRDAQVLAGIADIQLVRVLDVSLDQPQIYAHPGPNLHYMAKAEFAPVIEAPDVDLRANVSITFEIASKKTP